MKRVSNEASVSMYVTAREIATMLAIGVGALDRAIQTGKFIKPDFTLNTRVRRWRRDRLERWLADGSPEPATWRG